MLQIDANGQIRFSYNQLKIQHKLDMSGINWSDALTPEIASEDKQQRFT